MPKDGESWKKSIHFSVKPVFRPGKRASPVAEMPREPAVGHSSTKGREWLQHCLCKVQKYMKRGALALQRPERNKAHSGPKLFSPSKA
jgi:hypothetical protein